MDIYGRFNGMNDDSPWDLAVPYFQTNAHTYITLHYHTYIHYIHKYIDTIPYHTTPYHTIPYIHNYKHTLHTYITLHYTLHTYITLHYTTLHYITLHYITLH